MNTLEGVLFLCVFHLIGGVAIGVSLRHLIDGNAGCQTLFLIVWGLGFGGLPLLNGVTASASGGGVGPLVLELSVFLGAITISGLIPRNYLSAFDAAPIGAAAVGGLLFVIGGAITLSTLRSGFGTETLMGLVLTAVGALVAGLTLINLWRKQGTL